MNNEDQRLLRCLFCGSSDVVAREIEERWIAVECQYCGCLGPSAGTIEDAEDYWNNRDTTDSQEN